MKGSESSSPESGGLEPFETTADAQRIRLRRLGMSVISYAITYSLVLLCWAQGIVPGRVALLSLVAVVAVNLTFFLLIRSGLNLRFRDPSLTLAQIAASLPPFLYVMYFLEAGQARAFFLFLSLLPTLFGVLALNTRQFIAVGAWYLACYGVLLAALAAWRPAVLVPSLELLQLLAVILVGVQVALLGGYIHGLRVKLRERNLALNDALARISDLASRDSLTGVFNRRYLLDALEQEAARCDRSGTVFCVCLLDVDHFKRVNDAHGHVVGDTVLRAVARAVAQNLRSSDCFGRYGGEEFLLLLPQTRLAGAVTMAERAREQVSEIHLADLGEAFRLTASLGVAEYRPGEHVDQLIVRADAALYLAKARGRNRTMTEVDLADAHDGVPVA